MTTATLEKIHEDILSVKNDLRHIMEQLDENFLELGGETKSRIDSSRKRPLSEFKTQDYMEKKFS